ncbi:MAG: ADP-ribosylglycohydrolase family protein [Planctomycetota bacterium]
MSATHLSEQPVSGAQSDLSEEAEHDADAWSRCLTWIGGVDLDTEYAQAYEEGRDLSSLQQEFDQLLAVPRASDQWFPHRGGGRGADWQRRAALVLDAVQRLPMRPDFLYSEPDRLEAIRRVTPAEAVVVYRGDSRDFHRRVHGGLLGRICGCMLGKPVEGHDRRSIRVHAEATGRWPIADYFLRPDPEQYARIEGAKPDKMPKPTDLRFYAGEIDGAVIDDDINYTVIGYEILRRCGAAFRPLDVAEFWVTHLPMRTTCTAERLAYRNFAMGILPSASATYRNPCREWIGADIRADYYGYANPGDPRRAAEWAFRDASVSHVKNGVYGSMFVAAMLAAAFVLDDLRLVVEAGLAQIPARCRLAEAVRLILDRYEAGTSWEQMIEEVHAEWDEFTHHGWCHTISNAQIMVAALLWGEGDYSQTICKAVMPGFDTDCNAATAGSIWGVMYGVDAIPSQWSGPIRDVARSSIEGWREFSIAHLAGEMADTAIANGALRGL